MRTNWFMWFIILSFGMTVTGVIASVLVEQLGFPYTWVTPLSLVMLGTVLVLVYRGYPLNAWLLVACIGFILISGLALLRALTVSDPRIPDVYRAEFDTANLGPSMFGVDNPYFSTYVGDYTIEYDPGRATYLVEPGYERPTLLTIDMPPIETAGGQWAFAGGALTARGGGMNDTFTADPANNWFNVNELDFDLDQAPRTVRPELAVEVPLPFYPSRNPIQVDVSLDIVYPRAGELVEQTLTRNFAMQIIDYTVYPQYESHYLDWQRSRTVIETPLWVVLVVGSVVAGGSAVYLVREGGLRPTGAGGLQVVVRRLSGAQKIGAEFHPLDKFRDRTDAEQGVFVGRVVAQSPAGRAGLLTGDVLVELDGKPINTPGAVNRLAKSKKKNERASAMVLRDGARVELLIRF